MYCLHRDRRVLKALPPALGKELMDELYMQSVKNVPIFRGLQEEVVVRICYALKPLQTMQHEIIFKENQLGQDMYIIEKGTVRLSKMGITLSNLSAGSFFGEDSLSHGRHLRRRTAVALTNLDLTFITKSGVFYWCWWAIDDSDLILQFLCLFADIRPIADDYPILMEKIDALSQRRQARDSEKLSKLVDETALALGVSSIYRLNLSRSRNREQLMLGNLNTSLLIGLTGGT